MLLSVSSNEPSRRNLISNDNEGFVKNRTKHALEIGPLHRLLAVLLEKANDQRRIWSIIPGMPTFPMER